MKFKNVRIDLIKSIARDQEVLDVGCVDHDASQSERDEWLHAIICSVAKDVVGLDYAENEVKKLNARGYRVIYGNAEEIDLGREFDCVIAGELIEHLDNPGRFLRNMHHHLKPGGKILLTTPNPFYPKRMLEILFSEKPAINPEHVAWFCPQTISVLLARSGFSDINVIPFNNSEGWFGIGRLPSVLRPWYATNLIVHATR